jgi:hypothetical protein
MVNFMVRPLYRQENSHWYPLDRRLGVPQSRSGCGSKEKLISPSDRKMAVTSPAFYWPAQISTPSSYIYDHFQAPLQLEDGGSMFIRNIVMHHVPPKYSYSTTSLHVFATQKTASYNFIFLKAPNLSSMKHLTNDNMFSE